MAQATTHQVPACRPRVGGNGHTGRDRGGTRDGSGRTVREPFAQ